MILKLIINTSTIGQGIPAPRRMAMAIAIRARDRSRVRPRANRLTALKLFEIPRTSGDIAESGLASIRYLHNFGGVVLFYGFVGEVCSVEVTGPLLLLFAVWRLRPRQTH